MQILYYDGEKNTNCSEGHDFNFNDKSTGNIYLFFLLKYIIIVITFIKSTKEVVDNVSDAENCNSNYLNDSLINDENA